MKAMIKRAFTDYKKYLDSEVWSNKKQLCIKLFGKMCYTGCGRVAKYLHHRHYKNLGTEPPHQLVLLCKECHELVHGLPDNFTRNEKQMKLNLRRLLKSPKPKSPTEDKKMAGRGVIPGTH